MTPADWDVLHLRRLAECWDHLRIPMNAEERHYRQGEVPYWGANTIQGYVDTALVDEEVVLIGEDGAPFFERDRPVAFHITEPIWPNNHIHILKPRHHVDGRWLSYALNDVDYSLYVGGSTRDKLTQRALMRIALTVPSASQQRTIANYLDRETAKIDTLIEEQQRLIEMLRERRQSVISWAIVDDAQHYKRVALRFLSTVPVENGVDEQGNAGNSADWPRFIRTTDVKTLTQLDPEKRVTVSPTSAVEAPVEVDDLLLTRAGASVGKSYIHLIDDPSCYAGYMVRVRPDRRRVEPMYLAYWTETQDFADQIATGLVKSTIENFSASKYRAMQVPLQSLDAQRRIANYLKEQTSKIDKLIAETERFIELSKERRAALITAAVTGQIDVRDQVGVGAA